MSEPFDQNLYRQALGQFATGVTVISFIRESQVCAMTVNSFTSVSLSPPLILFCPGLATRFALEAVVGEPFSVSILAQQQKNSCFHYAGRSEVEPCRWQPAEATPPVLEGCIGWLRCRTTALHEHGDHLVVIGEVSEFGSDLDRDPLLFFRGTYPILEAAEKFSSTLDE